MKNQVDPIIEEIHETRREIARRFDYDVHQISEDAKRRQMLEGKPVWQPGVANQRMQLTGDRGQRSVAMSEDSTKVASARAEMGSTGGCEFRR